MDSKIAKVLPEGWQEVRLGDVCSFRGGSGFPEIYQGKNAGDYPFIKVSDMSLPENKVYIHQSNNWITSEVKKQINATHCPANSIVFAKVGAALKLNRRRILMRDTIIDNNMMAAIPRTSETFPKFLYYYLITKDFGQLCQESAVPSVNQKILGNLLIKLPPIESQKAIASLLETWDTAIEKTEALIAAKEKRFKWLLKTLIRDQQNNPEWKVAKLENICKIRKGEQLNKLQMVETGKYPALNGGVAPSGYTDGWNTPANTVTISEGGNSCGYVNLSTRKFWAGGHCYTLTDVEGAINTNFLYYQLKGEEPSIMKLRVGSGLPNIQKGDIDKFPIFFPPLTRQKQIAYVLNAAQCEIDFLKQLIEKYRAQKRGLMQKLLTGKWRVKPC